MTPENCDCDTCDHETAGGVGGFCVSCAGYHIAVLRNTVAKLKGESCMEELVQHGGLLEKKEPKFHRLP